MTLTYKGSMNYINALRRAVYNSPLLQSMTLFNNSLLAQAGGENPSQFNIASNLSPGGGAWNVWEPDLYGYANSGSCTACTISEKTLTLGGTITGMFLPGQVIFGLGVTGNSIIISGVGKASGDTVALSQSSSVRVGLRCGVITFRSPFPA